MKVGSDPHGVHTWKSGQSTSLVYQAALFGVLVSPEVCEKLDSVGGRWLQVRVHILQPGLTADTGHASVFEA